MTLDSKGTIVLVDISAIAHAIWHTSETVSNRDQISASIRARVRSVSTGFAYVAVCCDSGRSFRHEIDPKYKANRAEREAGLHFQLDKAIAKLKEDGFVVWQAKGFEADDIIASAVAKAKSLDLSVMIASNDKDLFQLVGPSVVMKSLTDGSILDEAAVEAKCGVKPAQVRDFLTLMGDTSDNVPGAAGVGKVRAAKLLTMFETLDNLYTQLEAAEPADIGLTPAIAKSLVGFREQMPTTRKLITLNEDVPLAIEDLLTKERPSIDLTEEEPAPETPMETQAMPEDPIVTPAETEKAVGTDVPAIAAVEKPKPEAPAKADALATIKADDAVIDGEIVWERQLEPRSMNDAARLATILDKSGLFLSSLPNAPAVMTAVLAGRELGLSAMASLRGIHMIEGKAALSASLMVALIIQRGIVEYFEMESGDDQSCTFVAKRKGARKEQRITHTIEMAQRAGLVKPNSNWVKVPEDMLAARASSRLARLVAPDVLFGLYTPEELIEAKETA
jgi:5'-3' exonuclease